VEKSSTFPPRKADGCTRKSHDIQQITSRTGPTPNYSECPPYGSKSVIGRRAKMEDAFKAVPNLMQVPLHREADELLPPRLAPQLRTTSSSSRCSAETAAAAAAAAAGVPQTVIPAVPAISGSETQQAGSITTSGSAFTAQIGPGGLTICPPDQSSVEVLHFFGVFDGHGGADAAMHCAKTLHERVKEALSSVTSPSGGSGNRGTPSPTEIQTQQEAVGKQEEKFSLRGSAAAAEAQVAEEGGVEGSSTSHTVATDIPLSSTFESGSSDIDFMDAVDLEASEGGGNEVDPNGGMLRADGAGRLRHAASIEGLPCTTETVEAALTKAFHLTDEEFGEMGGYEHLALVGTTAVVALIGGRMIYVANCGDSRAVLCRDGQAIPLSDDHKAAREDETARVEAAGGQILFWNGVRVMGLLAVSRAIGDHSLRPYVIAEPEVTIVNRYPDDEVLIMASDGLWDVMSNQEACNLAKKCLLRARQRGSTRHSAAKVAATVLTRAAVDRGSRDNVTVVIVDLTLEGEGLQGKRDEISVPLPLKPSLRSSDGIEIENLPCSTIWDTKVPLNGSSGNDGSNEEEMPGAPAPDATPAAPQSPFDVPMPSEGTAGAPLTAVTIEGNPQQQAIHPRGSIPMTSPFSTD
jgi:serine/threonine protein phosphatase PrpC